MAEIIVRRQETITGFQYRIERGFGDYSSSGRAILTSGLTDIFLNTIPYRPG